MSSLPPEPRPETPDPIAEDLAELALGVLPGERRAVVLEHLEHCTSCREELAALTHGLDALLLATPPVAPPAGFEARLLRQLSEHRPRPRRRALAVAAAVFALAGTAAGAGATWALHSSPPVTSTARPLVALFTAARSPGVRGELVVTSGRAPWVLVTLAPARWPAWVSCELVLANGTRVAAGRYEVTSEGGAWSLPLTVRPGALVGARLVADTGRVLATAALPR